MAICPAIFAAIFFVSCADQGVGAPLGEPMSIEVFAGAETAGYADGEGQAARFNNLYGIDVAPNGTIYVADQNNQRIRKITATGLVSTLAGSGEQDTADGQGSAAEFDNPQGIAVAADGTIYVADRDSDSIRKITPAGLVSTLPAGIDDPEAIAVAPDASFYVTNNVANRGIVYKITLDGTAPTPFSAPLMAPSGIAVAADGTVYVGTFNSLIYKLTPGPTPITPITFAGVDGTAGSADGQGTAARFDVEPQGVTVGPDGNIYVADGGNGIRKITPTGLVSTLIKGTLIKGILARDIAFTPDGSTAYITEPTRILKLRFR